FQRSGPDRSSRSFPTRRSSDLSRISRAVTSTMTVTGASLGRYGMGARGLPGAGRCKTHIVPERRGALQGGGPVVWGRGGRPGRRSEEHTSELQSRENLVCRLLL